MENPTTEAKLVEAIVAYLPGRGAAGEGESISFVLRNLQSDGWRGVGPLYRFADRCVELGFDVREGTNDRGQRRTEVALPGPTK